MRIALIIHELLVEGGGERQCIELARRMARNGHQIAIFTSAYDPLNCFPKLCRNVNIINVGRGRLRWLRKPLPVRGFLDMRRLVARVHQQFDVWNPHHWPAQWGAVWLKRKLGGRVVWNCNDVPIFYEKARQRQTVSDMFLAALRWLYYFYDRSQNDNVDLTLLLSNWAESNFKAIYSGPTRIVRAGVDSVFFTPGGDRDKIRGRFGYAPEQFVLLWLGIFMPHRRLQDVIHAISRLRHRGLRVNLLLAGSDRSYPTYFQSLNALTRQLGIEDQVTFSGKVDEDEIRDFYCACDAFVFPNEHQTWGLAVFEAMACGSPVLVSQGAAISEVLTDNETALLFPPRNPDVLADKIELMVLQPSLRQELAANGLKLTAATYSWDSFADHFYEACSHLFGVELSSAHVTDTVTPSRDELIHNG